MTAKLTLTRQPSWARKPWPISIDGTVAGSIARDATVDLEVTPGEHTLRLGTGRYRSPDREFLATDGEEVRFRCRGRYTLGGFLLGLLKPDFQISLHQQ